MSLDDARSLYVRLATDEQFLTRIAATETAEERQALVDELGLDFTAEELETATREWLESDTVETYLSEHAEVVGYMISNMLGVTTPSSVIRYGSGWMYTDAPLTEMRQVASQLGRGPSPGDAAPPT